VTKHTSGVTVGPDKLTSLALESVGVPDGLVEERGETSLETLGALSTINHAGVSDVALVVLGGDILAVPARREHDLGADTVGAVLVHELLVGKEVTVAGALRGLVVVHAVEAKRLLHESLLGHVVLGPLVGWRVGNGTGEVAVTAVTSEHLEALGESLEVLAEEEVVCKHTTNLGDDLGLATLVDEVQRRGPVGRLVVAELARRAGRVTEHLIGGGLSEV
jgi:hypothetical protein